MYLSPTSYTGRPACDSNILRGPAGLYVKLHINRDGMWVSAILALRVLAEHVESGTVLRKSTDLAQLSRYRLLQPTSI